MRSFYLRKKGRNQNRRLEVAGGKEKGGSCTAVVTTRKRSDYYFGRWEGRREKKRSKLCLTPSFEGGGGGQLRLSPSGGREGEFLWNVFLEQREEVKGRGGEHYFISSSSENTRPKRKEGLSFDL